MTKRDFTLFIFLANSPRRPLIVAPLKDAFILLLNLTIKMCCLIKPIDSLSHSEMILIFQQALQRYGLFFLCP